MDGRFFNGHEAQGPLDGRGDPEHHSLITKGFVVTITFRILNTLVSTTE